MADSLPTGDSLHRVVTRFVEREARLLDAQRWDEWDALFTEDGLYWLPAAPGQSDWKLNVSLMLDNALLRKVRIRRFASPEAYSLQPFPRSVHFVTNIEIDAVNEKAQHCTVFSKVLMVQSQRDIQQVYAGTATHDLHWINGSFRIRMKRVELVNCDAALPSLHLYI